MPHAKLAEAKRSQNVFTAIYRRQTFDGHLSAISNSRRQARTGWFVPCRQASSETKLPHFAFVQTNFNEGTAHIVFVRGSPPGPIVLQVISSRTINNVLNAPLASHRFQLLIQLILTKETSIGTIGHILRLV